MDLLIQDSRFLKNLSRINIIAGRNGCGKSTLMKDYERQTQGRSGYGKIGYITPQRGGDLFYNVHVEGALISNPGSFHSDRNRNSSAQFREQSVAQYKKLELMILRHIENNRESLKDFNSAISRINALLENIKIQRHDSLFKIVDKHTNAPLEPNHISSGEAELITLAIEGLVFESECVEGSVNILFLDEPDAHLHPDLQYKFCNFLKDIAKNDNIVFIIATHSTAVISALADYEYTRIAFIQPKQQEVIFSAIKEKLNKILPIFGAHPLSSVFNQNPILLVEGEDDERIWQQAIRTSNGKLSVYPCFVESINNLEDFENEVIALVKSIYDTPKAFSLRDRDESEYEISNKDFMIRTRLFCRAAENLLLTDEVLERLDITWQSLQTSIELWLSQNQAHQYYPDMLEFKDGGYNRATAKLKNIRNIIMGLTPSNDSWERAIGKTIGEKVKNDTIVNPSPTSLSAFLGDKVIRYIIKKEIPSNDNNAAEAA